MLGDQRMPQNFYKFDLRRCEIWRGVSLSLLQKWVAYGNSTKQRSARGLSTKTRKISGHASYQT
jgi:hypothetical protein